MGRFRYVYARPQSRWEVRHPEHGRIGRDAAGKRFSSDMVAARHRAKLLQVDFASLRTGVQVSKGRRKFKYVFWHAGHERWVAKPPGSSMTTRDEKGLWFASQDHAATFVMKQLGLTSVEDLSIQKSSHAKQSSSSSQAASSSGSSSQSKRPGVQESRVQESKITRRRVQERSVQESKVARRYKYACWHAPSKNGLRATQSYP